MDNILDGIRQRRPKRITLEPNFNSVDEIIVNEVEPKEIKEIKESKESKQATNDVQQKEVIDFSKVKKFCCLRHIKLEHKGYMVKGQSYSIAEAFKGIKNPEKHLARLYETKKIRFVPEDTKTVPQDMILRVDIKEEGVQDEAARIRMLVRSRKNNA